jgi:hypothetical protein
MNTEQKTAQQWSQWAHFNGFELCLPIDCVSDCTGAGAADEAVDYWSHRIDRPPEATSRALRCELREYGAWDERELSDDDENWRRIVWIAAGNVKDEMREVQS